MPINCRCQSRSVHRLAADQGPALRTADATPSSAMLDNGKTNIDLWYSPNTPKTGTPKTRTVPPDLQFVF